MSEMEFARRISDVDQQESSTFNIINQDTNHAHPSPEKTHISKRKKKESPSKKMHNVIVVPRDTIIKVPQN